MNVLTVDFHSSTAPADFTRSLKETGFGVVRNHPIDIALLNQTYDAWQQFFALPEAEKQAYFHREKEHDGFFPTWVSEKAVGQSVLDLKEYYHFYPWGRVPDAVQACTLAMYKQMESLAKILLNWIEMNTPEHIRQHFSMPLSQMVDNSPRTLLRVLHYPPLTGKEAEGAVRAAAHGDINFITLLPTATAPGLQVQDLKGHWHDVPCDPGAIVVNIADMLSIVSQGYYPSTIHRVCNPVGEAAKQSRLSMPLFLHGQEDVMLTPTLRYKDCWRERLIALGVVDGY